MEPVFAAVHPMHMARNPKKPPQKPKWRVTFLRAWREHHGKSLEVVAAKMGKTHGQLSRIERGISPYTQKILEIAAVEYGCTVQDLLSRAPTEADSIFGVWGKLDDAQRRRAVRMFEAMIED